MSSKKRNISFTKPPEPSFIKKMKESMGYQEPDTIDTKREAIPYDPENDAERDDEKPVVVVLKPGDLSEEEIKQMEEENVDENKKITFSKPVKKNDDEKNSLDFSSKKKIDLRKRIESEKEKTKKVKNSSLLSFNEEDDY